MTAPDPFRLLALALFASVAAQAAVINFHVWRSRRRGPIRVPQLLAWHVHAVSVYVLGTHGLLLVTFTADRIGNPTVTHPWVLAGLIFFGALGNAAMFIIGHVTAARRKLQAAAT